MNRITSTSLCLYKILVTIIAIVGLNFLFSVLAMACDLENEVRVYNYSTVTIDLSSKSAKKSCGTKASQCMPFGETIHVHAVMAPLFLDNRDFDIPATDHKRGGVVCRVSEVLLSLVKGKMVYENCNLPSNFPKCSPTQVMILNNVRTGNLTVDVNGQHTVMQPHGTQCFDTTTNIYVKSPYHLLGYVLKPSTSAGKYCFFTSDLSPDGSKWTCYDKLTP